jgi:hypothetical protein
VPKTGVKQSRHRARTKSRRSAKTGTGVFCFAEHDSYIASNIRILLPHWIRNNFSGGGGSSGGCRSVSAEGLLYEQMREQQQEMSGQIQQNSKEQSLQDHGKMRHKAS